MVTTGRWPVWLRAIYNTFAPFIFVTCVMIFLTPLFMGDRMVVLKDFLSTGVFRLMAKISYSVYLVYPFMFNYYLCGTLSYYYLSHTEAIFLFFNASITSYFFGFMLALFVEFPMVNLWKFLIAPR